MTYEQCLRAHAAITRMAGIVFGIKEAYAIFKLGKRLSVEVEFCAQHEKALIEKYNGMVQKDGSIHFVHGDDEESKRIGMTNMEQFKNEMNQLLNSETEGNIEPVHISLDAFEDYKITPDDIMALDNIIIFE